jgi:glucose-6-phosphate isomerase
LNKNITDKIIFNMRLNTSPLNISFTSGFLYKDGKKLKPEVRKLKEMKDVLYDKSISDGERVTYYMYRNICREEDKGLFEKHGVRYDITVMPPILLGKEFNKTYGHYHPIASNNLTFPEIYEVLHGNAHYLIQRTENRNVIDVRLIKAKKGDKVIIPPNYGHITINPGKKVLIMANLVSSRFSSDYTLIKKMQGGVYFETEEGFVKNMNYKKIPKLIVKNAKKLKLLSQKNIYALFIQKPEIFLFLNQPEKVSEIF